MSLESELRSIVGEAGLLQQHQDAEPFVTEWRDRYRGKARLVVMPDTTEEVASVVALCARDGIAIVPQGGNTGLCGGAIPDQSGSQVILSLRRMQRIRSVSAEDYAISVDAGCTLQQVQEAALEANRFFPLSLSAEGSCQIGGNLSTDAGGINVLRYGTARDQALGLEVVLPDGRILDSMRSLRKDTAGYDLKQIFIGAEGTLGVITGASLKLEPLPQYSNTAMVAIDSPQGGVRLLAALRDRLGNEIQAFELMPQIGIDFVTRHIPGTRAPFESRSDWYILTECNVPQETLESALGDIFESGLINDATIAKNERESIELWRLRHSMSEAQKLEGASLKHDVSVPLGAIGEFIERAEETLLQLVPSARPVSFGHVGDGNVHLNISQPIGADPAEFLALSEKVARAVYDLVADLGGSFSAEHGVGIARREYLGRYRSDAELSLMRTLKSALDPQGLMNPGKVL